MIPATATLQTGESTQADASANRERAEREAWRLVQAVTSLALAAALAWALVEWVKVREHLPLTPPQRVVGWVLIVAGLGFFTVRGLVLGLRWSTTRDRGGAFR